MKKRILFKIQFDGSAYCGWQLQSEHEGQKGKHSIQYVFEKNLAILFSRPGERMPILACSRTDSGVHAREFYFHFDYPFSYEGRYRDLKTLKRSINGLIPKDIVVLDILNVNEDFHSNLNVEKKEYQYYFLIAPQRIVTFPNKHWHCSYSFQQFDFDLYQKAIQKFCGKHDFKSFAAANMSSRTSIREIFTTDVKIKNIDDNNKENGCFVESSIEGSGFLKQMIRNIVGTCVDVAAGQIELDRIDQLLQRKFDRTQAGQCAPACGLYLNKVVYNGLD